MKKLFYPIAAMVMLLSFLTMRYSYATKYEVTVQNFFFNPTSITTVYVGDTIRWVWISGTHTTTSTSVPLGAATWNNPINSTTTSFDYKVTVVGTYNYDCAIHTFMTGSFTATPAPTLSVLPSNQNVTAPAGTTSFTVTSNSSWNASSDQTWCSVTPSGTGDGTITANYSQNTSASQRIASITVTVTGHDPVVVTVTQAGTPDKLLNITLFLEGLFNGTSMNKAQNGSGNQFPGTVADEITVELHNSASPYALEGGPYVVDLNTNGTASLTVPASLGADYYIFVKNRNSIETSTTAPVSFAGDVISYNFSTTASQAYGDNMKLMGSVYVIYGGDATQDGFVDGSDMAAIDNASTAVLVGYFPEDINGDGIVDGSDMALIDNNSTAVVQAQIP